MEFDEHEEEEEEDEDDEEEIGIRLPITTTATSTYESSRATKMAAAAAAGSSCRYRECLKNHAVNIGGHAVDGCGEFMPAGEEGTLDALKCAACNCHRNFHRKEIAGEEGAIIMANTIPTPTGFHHPPFFHRSNIPAGYLHIPPHLRPPPPPLALPSTSGGGGGQSREDQEDISNPSSGGGGGGSSSRKRFRTKFSQEQKDKMLAFAERLGWRIQKHDEAAVQQFCTEICVKRHVLKVWMHNNKHTLGKKP